MFIAYIILALFGMMFLLNFALFCSLEFGNQESTQLQPDEIPPYVKEPLQAEWAELESLGFVVVGANWLKKPRVDFLPETFDLVFWHAEKNVLAQVLFGTLALREDLGSIIFTSVFSDGHRLLTYNGLRANWSLENDNATTTDALVPSIAAHFTAHEKQLEKLIKAHGRSEKLQFEEVLPLSRKFWEGDWEAMRRAGVVVPLSDAKERFSVRHAAKRAWMLQNQGGAAQKLRRKRWVTMTAAKDKPLSIETEAYLLQQEQKVQIPPLKRVAKLGLFAASVLVFLASFSFGNTGSFLAILVVVLFIHELGHFYAMKFFGGKDLNILFIPFFGAVAIGNNLRLSGAQQIIMLLAGPLPGMLIGLGLFLCPHSIQDDLMGTTAAVFFWLNFLNLLPIMPFDGGRVLHTVLGAHLVRTAILFQLVGALLLSVFGLVLNPLLSIIGVFSFFSTLRHNRSLLEQGKLKLELQRLPRSDSGAAFADACKTVIARFQSPQLLKLPLAARLKAGKEMLDACAVGSLSKSAALLFAVGYCATLVGAPYAIHVASKLRHEVAYMKFLELQKSDPDAAILLGQAMNDDYQAWLSAPSTQFALIHDLVRLQEEFGLPTVAYTTVQSAISKAEILGEIASGLSRESAPTVFKRYASDRTREVRLHKAVLERKLATLPSPYPEIAAEIEGEHEEEEDLQSPTTTQAGDHPHREPI
jgi:Zn-dependent protease